MKHCQNKSNISVIRDYLDGERPFTQVGYVKPEIKRNIGDEWEDLNGVTWKQENGYRKRVNKQADIIRKIREEKCIICKSSIKWGTKLDKYFFYRTGLCESCLVDYETKLRILGIYDYYEKYKLLSYELGSLKDWKSKLNEVIKYFSENTGDVELLCNSEGFTERWKNTNREEILKNAQNDLKFICEKLEDVSKLKEIARTEYVMRAEKNQMEYYV